jgi:hypothetical protein
MEFVDANTTSSPASTEALRLMPAEFRVIESAEAVPSTVS